MSDQLELSTPPRGGAADRSRLTAADAFNGAVVASAVCAAFELGLLDELQERGGTDPDTFATRQGLDRQAFDAVLLALQHAEVVRQEPLAGESARIGPGPGFADVWRNKGYFLWLLGGYGTMLARAADLCRADGRQSPHYTRDGAAIARAGRDYGGQFVDPVFDRIVADIGYTRAADLGCGSGRRLMSLARSKPDGHFLGVDIDAGAVREAQAGVAAEGLADRISIVRADLAELATGCFPGVDLVFSFFMAHDLLPRRRFLDVLDGLRRAFPDARALLLSDTHRSATAARPEAPIFTLGFEYTHGLMRQYLPTLDEWRETFAESAWELRATHRLGIADSVVFHLVPAGGTR